MTGFAATSMVLFADSASPINISMNLKSLNSRFFEATCKLPYALNNLETECIKLFKRRLHRGHVYFTVYASNQHMLHCMIKPNLEVVRGYIEAINTIKESCHLEGNLAVHDILGLPHIFNIEERNLGDDLQKQLLDAIDLMIDEVLEARKKEGLSLKKDFEQRLSIVQPEIEAIEKAFNTLMEQQKILVHDELENLDAVHADVAESRRQTLYGQLDKIDINEEIVRFKSHLANFASQLGSPVVEKGKKLDFILQELAREINTIAAKCSDSTISSLAINIKVELEKAREQVQNIV